MIYQQESATVQSILPEIIPIEELSIDSKASTVPEQQWHRKIMIDPKAKPLLTTIKPDRTVGWSRRMFEYPRALKYLDARACPVASNPGLAWPLFTAEVKGDNGDLKVARLQNLHNGATMLSNLLHIRKFYREEEEEEFFNKVHAMSSELTVESIAVRGESGDVKYYGMQLCTWTPHDGSQYKEARRCVCNALDWVKAQAFEWICSAMKTLEGAVSPSGPTPPPTQSDQPKTRRPTSFTSESRSSGTHSKKPSSTKMWELLNASSEEAGAGKETG